LKNTVTLKFGLKVSLKPNYSAENECEIKVKTEVWFKTEVNLNNPVLNQTCSKHLDRQFC